MFKENRSITYFYIISHIGLFFIADAIYFDDWFIYGVGKRKIFEIFNQAGSFLPFTSYLHAYLLPLGPWTYRILTFISFFVVTHLFDRIIFNSKLVNDEMRYVLVLFFTVLPFNIARVALINFPYTVCLTLFFIAWRYKHIRYIALPLFFISFATNSLPFFYIIIMAHFYHEFAKDFKWRTILKFVKARLDYLSLPLVYFSIKYTYYVPFGDYLGYNGEFSLKNLLMTPFFQILHDGFYLTKLNFNFPLTLILILLTIKILPKFSRQSELIFEHKKVFIFGLLSLLICLFPYWILALIPTFRDWASRHQLLMPFGSAIILVSIYYYLEFNYRRIFLILIVVTSVSIRIYNYVDFFRDWNKQKEIVEILNKERKEPYNNKIIFVEDYTLNALGRSYRIHEWNGLFNYALGKSNDRAIFNWSELKNFELGKLDSYINKINPEIKNKKKQFLTIRHQKPNSYFERQKQYFFPKLNIQEIRVGVN